MLAIDHIVIAVNDPKQAAEAFSEQHNVTIVQGGRHENWGTYNYLAYFSNDCYIEWIGIFDENIARNSTNPLIKQLVHVFDELGEGFYQFAFRTKEIDKYVTHFTKEGIPFSGPISGSRRKPDGSLLEWRMLFPEENLLDPLPFLVEWGKTHNMPEDPALINDGELHSIDYNVTNKEKFNRIFKILSDDDSVLLTNGTLHKQAEQGLSFEIN